MLSMLALVFWHAIHASILMMQCTNAKVCEMLMLAYASMAYAKCQMPWQEC